YIALNEDSNFTALAAQVHNFYTVIATAREQQLQQKGILNNAGSMREINRKLMAEELWAAKAMLQFIYKNNPAAAADFFDLTLLQQRQRNKSLATYKKVLPPATTENTDPLPPDTRELKVTLVNG